MPIDLLTLLSQWSPEASATFAALLFGHMLGDYVFQTRTMVARKRTPLVFAAHIALIFVTALAALGGALVLAAFTAVVHAAIDVVKTYALPARVTQSLPAYLGDQSVHILSLAALALWMPGAVTSGLWSGLDLVKLHITLSGFLFATLAGGPAVGLLMHRFDVTLDDGLPDAGRIIGLLERGLIFILLMLGQITAVGFLIAAKSVLRFDTVSKGRGASEYVIVGTLASFGWALLAGLATTLTLDLMSP